MFVFTPLTGCTVEDIACCSWPSGSQVSFSLQRLISHLDSPFLSGRLPACLSQLQVRTVPCARCSSMICCERHHRSAEHDKKLGACTCLTLVQSITMRYFQERNTKTSCDLWLCAASQGLQHCIAPGVGPSPCHAREFQSCDGSQQ